VHKSQGSEFPAVVLCLIPAHYVMLQRNLLYTALTRARRLSVVVGSPRALGAAVSNDRVVERYTILAGLL
jgi:exodeoxyribonuclease V alpha subunit